MEEVKNEKFYLTILIDILGFENQYKKLGLSGISEKYDLLINKTIADDTLWARGFFNFGGRTAMAALLESPVKFINFSDTVLLWLSDLNAMNVNATIQKLNELICKSIEIEFPIRGAISVGKAIIDKEKNIFIGQPIISCARAEQSQSMIGIGFASDWFFGVGVYPEALLPYTKHIKEGKENNILDIVLDFPRHWRDTRKTDLEKELEKLKNNSIDLMDSENCKIEKYYDNTIEFCSYSERMKDVPWENEYNLKINKKNSCC